MFFSPINVISSVQLLSNIQLFVTPSTVAHQASLSINISWSLLKLMSIKSVMPSNHLVVCHPLSILLSAAESVYEPVIQNKFPNVFGRLHHGAWQLGKLWSSSLSSPEGKHYVLPLFLQNCYPSLCLTPWKSLKPSVYSAFDVVGDAMLLFPALSPFWSEL